MKDITDLFDHSTENRVPTHGSLLVAEPFLKEEWFARSVIAMVNVTPGTNMMGIVLGNESDSTLGDLIHDEPLGAAAASPVFIGGPVDTDRLFAVHTLGAEFDPEGLDLGNGLRLAHDLDLVIDAARAGGSDKGILRFFVGYAGWTPGQLEEEINNDVWALTDPDTPLSGTTLLTTKGDRQWQYAVRALGLRHRHWLLHPRQPQAN